LLFVFNSLPISFSNQLYLFPECCPDYFFQYEDAFNKFVDEINALAAYQWWEGSIYSILCILSYPMAWSWQQWRRRMKLQKIREFVRSEYDHSCLRSCRSRALYEGLKVAATPDLMLGYLDFFLGGAGSTGDQEGPWPRSMAHIALGGCVGLPSPQVGEWTS